MMERQNKIIGGLTLVALIALIAAFFAPILSLIHI